MSAICKTIEWAFTLKPAASYLSFCYDLQEHDAEDDPSSRIVMRKQIDLWWRPRDEELINWIIYVASVIANIKKIDCINLSCLSYGKISKILIFLRYFHYRIQEDNLIMLKFSERTFTFY